MTGRCQRIRSSLDYSLLDIIVFDLFYSVQKTTGSGNSKWDELFSLIDPSNPDSIAYPGKAAEVELKLTDLIPKGTDYFQYQVK